MTRHATFADRAEGGKLEVMSFVQCGTKTMRQAVAVGATEVAEHYQVLSQITPSLPTEKMAMIQQMAALREPNKVTGLPMVDDDSLREMNPEIFEDASRVRDRVEELRWRKEVPEIQQWEREDFMERWKKDHPPHIPQGFDLSKLTKPELIQRLALLQMMVENPQGLASALKGNGPANGQPPQASGALAAMMGGMPGGMSGAMPGGMAGMIPPGGMPGQEGPQLPTSLMPPQMQTGNPSPLQGQTETGLAAQQMAQGMPPAGGGGSY